MVISVSVVSPPAAALADCAGSSHPRLLWTGLNILKKEVSSLLSSLHLSNWNIELRIRDSEFLVLKLYNNSVT